MSENATTPTKTIHIGRGTMTLISPSGEVVFSGLCEDCIVDVPRKIDDEILDVKFELPALELNFTIKKRKIAQWKQERNYYSSRR